MGLGLGGAHTLGSKGCPIMFRLVRRGHGGVVCAGCHVGRRSFVVVTKGIISNYRANYGVDHRLLEVCGRLATQIHELRDHNRRCAVGSVAAIVFSGIAKGFLLLPCVSARVR